MTKSQTTKDDLLERAAKALDCWIATYASDFCDDEKVLEALKHIEANGGTLAYATNLRTEIEGALNEI